MDIKALELVEAGRHLDTQPEISRINFELELYDTIHNFDIVCRAHRVRIHQLTHLANQISDFICQETIDHHNLKCCSVSCLKGCSACCCYVISVSPAEIFAIMEKIDGLDRKEKTHLLRKMTIEARKIIQNISPIIGAGEIEDENLYDIAKWYDNLDIQCPFLENRVCSIYSDRPIVCREFMVNSHPKQCKAGLEGNRNIVDLPIKMAEIFTEICAKLLDFEPMTTFLPLASAWADNYSYMLDKTFDSQYAAELFIKSIEKHQQKNILLIKA
jgi:Fe-S-cluster containining protein